MAQLLYYYNIFYKKKYYNNKWQKIVVLELKHKFNIVYLAHLVWKDGNNLKDR